jgi:hypothetical protein
MACNGCATLERRQTQNPWWKLKWTMVIGKRLFERYGDPTHLAVN